MLSVSSVQRVLGTGAHTARASEPPFIMPDRARCLAKSIYGSVLPSWTHQHESQFFKESNSEAVEDLMSLDFDRNSTSSKFRGTYRAKLSRTSTHHVAAHLFVPSMDV